MTTAADFQREVNLRLIDTIDFFMRTYLKNIPGIGEALMTAQEETANGEIRQATARDLYMYLGLVNSMVTDMGKDIQQVTTEMREISNEMDDDSQDA